MAQHMSTQIKKLFDEFIDKIPDNKLFDFVKDLKTSFGNKGQEDNFGSDDFQLVFNNRSTDEATSGWFMIELRANPDSDNRAIEMLAKHSKKYKQNEKRFALIMFPPEVLQWIDTEHIKLALKASPVWDNKVINKVHVSFNEQAIIWRPLPGHAHLHYPEPRMPMLRSQMYNYLPVPFDGFKVDGTELSKSEKKKAGSSK